MWGHQGTFSWGGRNIQPWAVVAYPCYFHHAFSLAGCLCQQGRGELVSPAPSVLQASVRGKPATSSETPESSRRSLACGLHVVSLLVFTGWYIRTH